MSRLQEEYKKTISSQMMSKFNYKNIYQIPRLQKIVLNMGIGEAKEDAKILDKAQEELSLIAGQKAVKTKAKKAISNFKIREGDPVGVKVTLRSDVMYEFLDRFISVASPRIRDFRGFSTKSFDGKGNYSLGVNEQLVFPEVEYDKVRDIRGMNITICTTANDNNEGYVLLNSLGFPFREN